jgi:hypothetical protein
MFRRRRKTRAHVRSTEYASCKDFQQIFAEDMAGLHQLAFLLTADHTKAEQCFVAGLDDSIRGNPVFRQWARAWSKRAIIQNAIKMMAPVPSRPGTMDGTSGSSLHNGNSEKNTAIHIASNVASWEPFERFVFVMAVLEGYSLRECSTLLGCQVQDVIAAKSLALQRLAEQPQKESATENTGLQWTARLARAQVA